jgi:hypothetical protein
MRRANSTRPAADSRRPGKIVQQVALVALFVGGAVALVGVVVLFSALSAAGFLNQVKRARLCKVAEVQTPGLTLLRGRVVPSQHGTFPAAVTELPAVWAQQQLTTRIHKRQTTEYTARAVPFYLDDGSGPPALIMAEGGQSWIKERVNESWGGFGMPSPIVERWLSSQGPTRAAALRSGANRWLTESVVAPGDTVMVMGIARRAPEGVVVPNERSLEGKVHLFDKTRDELLGGNKKRRTIGVALALVGGLALGGGWLGMEVAEAARRERFDAEREAKDEAVKDALEKWSKIKSDAKKRDEATKTDLKLKKKGKVSFYYVDKKDDPGTRSFAPCAAVANDEKTYSPTSECSKATYVAVVRKRSMREPTVDEKTKKYDGGHYDGDALVYELESGKLMGGVVLSIDNRPELTIDERADKVKAVRGHLFSELEKKVTDAIEAAAQ